MLAAQCSLEEAEGIRKILLKNKIYDTSRIAVKEKGRIYFPVLKKMLGIKIISKKLQQRKIDYTFHSILKNKLPKKILGHIPRALDIIGDVAIIELPENLNKYYNLIGEAIMQANRQVKVVCRKAGFFEGEYRTRKLEVIAGEKRKETTYIENQVRMKLNVETCYFSPRLSNERMRIAKLVKPKEKILVMFSGVGPYSLTIAKHSKAQEIDAIEINPNAHKYALENTKMNHFNNIHNYLGDVRKIVPILKKKYHRIIMPLPMDAVDFLDVVLSCTRKNTVIHVYDFEKEEDIPAASKKKIKERIKKSRILKVIKCGQYSPGRYRVCIDIKLL